MQVLKSVAFIRAINHVSDVIQKMHFRSTFPLQSVSSDTETIYELRNELKKCKLNYWIDSTLLFEFGLITSFTNTLALRQKQKRFILSNSRPCNREVGQQMVHLSRRLSQPLRRNRRRKC